MKIKFKNYKGETVWLDGRLTIKDLVKLGITEVSLRPNEKPLPKNKRVFVGAKVK